MSLSRTVLGKPDYQQVEIENDGSGNPIYVGWAQPGSTTAQAVWLIVRFEYSGGFLVRSRFADHEVKYVKVWNDRATYNYA